MLKSLSENCNFDEVVSCLLDAIKFNTYIFLKENPNKEFEMLYRNTIQRKLDDTKWSVESYFRNCENR